MPKIDEKDFTTYQNTNYSFEDQKWFYEAINTVCHNLQIQNSETHSSINSLRESIIDTGISDPDKFNYIERLSDEQLLFWIKAGVAAAQLVEDRDFEVNNEIIIPIIANDDHSGRSEREVLRGSIFTNGIQQLLETRMHVAVTPITHAVDGKSIVENYYTNAVTIQGTLGEYDDVSDTSPKPK